MTEPIPKEYWAINSKDLLSGLGSSLTGLTSAEAQNRLVRNGANDFGASREPGALRLLWRQFESPLVLVLVFGAMLSFFLQQWADGAIILVIVFASAFLGFSQEHKASAALAELKQRLALTAKVRRGGQEIAVAVSNIVIGDIFLLSAGNIVPADGVVLESNDCLVTEASLTGESLPVEKTPGTLDAATPLAKRSNCVFSGTSLRSGVAVCLVTAAGRDTAFGQVAQRIDVQEPETEFERGVRHFGYLLIRVMLLMVVFVLVVSEALGRPIVESLLFSVALAVGMTPELLPAIVTITLATGARLMAKQGVIVRRLEAIENLGSIDVLCTDKTGTLTEGAVVMADALGVDGAADPEVLQLAFVNSAFEAGIENPLDEAISIAGAKAGLTTLDYAKVDEIPYDFTRKRLTIVVRSPARPQQNHMIAKGAFNAIMSICASVSMSGKVSPLDEKTRQAVQLLYEGKGKEGFRVLALATRDVPSAPGYAAADETGMTLVGLLLFADPPKESVRQAIADLAGLGIQLKMISGDSREVSAHVGGLVGIANTNILSGAEIASMSDEALQLQSDRTSLFVEVDPQQKERIIRALQKRGHAVGYMGDGINDAPALHAADVGISVESAVDVARQSADIVLLKQDLHVLRLGIESGRKSFANTLKYIAITTSANFGNMLSMALATPFLPFLPLLAKQILLNNFLSDMPSMAISGDNVDEDQVRFVERWDIADVRRFMIVFGLISSVFDVITFFLLLKIFKATETQFQTAWFVVSLLTEVAVVMVLRTRGWAFASRPGKVLLVATVAVFAIALGIPYLGPAAAVFGFVALPPALMLGLLAIVLGYVGATEMAKHWYYRRKDQSPV